MSAYNFRLHDAVVEALEGALGEHAYNLAHSRAADFGELRYRLGLVAGLEEALVIAEETRKRLIKE